MPVSVKAGGAWKPLSKTFVKVGGVWKEAQMYVKVGGVWKRASAVPLTIFTLMGDVLVGAVKLYVNGAYVHTFDSNASSFTVYPGDNVYLTYGGSGSEYSYVKLEDEVFTTTTYAMADTDSGPYGPEGLQTPTIQASVNMCVKAGGWNY